MHRTGMQQLAPDLVGDHEQVVTFGDIGDRSDLGRIENASGRVMRVAEEDHLGRGVDRALESCGVKTPSIGIKGAVDAPSAAVGDGVEKRVVDRREDDNAVAPFSRVPESDLEGVQRAGERPNLTLVRAPPMLAFLPVGVCGSQLSRERPVAQIAAIDVAPNGVQDGLWRVKVHVCHE